MWVSIGSIAANCDTIPPSSARPVGGAADRLAAAAIATTAGNKFEGFTRFSRFMSRLIRLVLRVARSPDEDHAMTEKKVWPRDAARVAAVFQQCGETCRLFASCL